MRRLILALTSIVLFVSASAQQDVYLDFSDQQEVIDDMLMEVQYDYKHIIAPQFNSRYFEDKMVLEIGKNMSHSYSEFDRSFDIRIESRYKLDKTRRMHMSYDPRIGETYVNYPKDSLTVLTEMDLAGVFRHKENIPDFQWKVLDEHKVVMGYDCTKAACSFRGRDYEAWFAPGIPMKYGPWKFCGLPGLIMEIHDTKKEYVFECIAITKPKNKHITFWNREYKDCTREEMRKYLYLLTRKPADFSAMYGHDARTIDGPITNEEWGYDKNVIEKE